MVPLKRLARRAGEPETALLPGGFVHRDLGPHACSLAALRIDELDVRDVDGGFALHDPALGIALVRPAVPFDDVHPFDDDAFAFGVDFENFAGFPSGIPG